MTPDLLPVAPPLLHTRLRMPLREDSLGTLTDAVDARLAGWGAPRGLIADARLVTEELGVNLIQYGRGPRGDTPPMELSLQLREGRLHMQFRDHGAAFDPWALPPPDLEADILERPIGGLGLHLVQQLAQAVAYRREGDTNVVDVTLAPSPPATREDGP